MKFPLCITLAVLLVVVGLCAPSPPAAEGEPSPGVLEVTPAIHPVVSVAPSPPAGPEDGNLCPPLPEPAGVTVTVSTEAALRDQAYNAPPGTTILIAPGTYDLQNFVHVVNAGITLRSTTGNRGDVILDAGGMVGGHTHGVLIEADDVTVADLTIRNAGEHGISINGSDRPVLYNLHILDTGSQLVKVNPVGDGSEDGLLACSRLEYTTTSPTDYTNGISAHLAHRWTVRDNAWLRIRTPYNDPVPTILFWSASTDTVVERNLLVDCYQGIAFGNSSHGEGDHTGGVVRNNMIYASLPHDSVIEMVHATDWLVAHNTALLLQPDGITWGIEARFTDTVGTFAYNLTNMPIVNRDDAQGTLTGNVTGAGASWFVNPGAADLHLLSSATDAIDQASSLPEVSDDYDGYARPIGAAPDVGADEFGLPPEFTPEAYLPVVTARAPAQWELLWPEDLTYLGAFRLPDVPDPYEFSWHWGGSAMTYSPDGDPGGAPDGYPGSLFATGHDWNQYVGEISIPVPIISPGKNVNELNTATMLQDFHDVRNGLFDHLEFELPRVALAYLPARGDQETGKLYFAWGQHNQEEETGVSHGWCEIDLASPQTQGAWHVGDYLNYVTNDYMFPIPQEWAASHTPGLELATGRFRDGGQGARGPSLIAIGPWNDGNPPPPGAHLTAEPLLLYTNVLSDDEHTMLNYHHSDEWSGGAWLSAGGRHAVVFAGTKGQGDCWYGCADGTVWEPPYPPECPDGSSRGWWSTSFVGQLLFYDPADLAAVAAGEIPPYAPQPYTTMGIDDPLYHITSSQQPYHLGAIAFDPQRGLLYVVEVLADDDKPLIHVLQVGE